MLFQIKLVYFFMLTSSCWWTFCSLHLQIYEKISRSVVPHSLWSHELQPTRLLCPWDFPVKDTVVVYHFLLQGIFLTRDWIWVSCTAGRVFIHSPTREALIYTSELMKSWLDWQTECSSFLPFTMWFLSNWSLLFPCRYGRIGAEFRRDSTMNWIWNKKNQMEVLVMTLPSRLFRGMRVRITLSLCNYFRLGKHL